MTITFEQGLASDIDEVAQLYDDLNDALAQGDNHPGWKKGIYPTRQTADDGIQEGNLYVARHRGAIVGSVILRHTPEPAYRGANWQIEADDDQVLVVYTFAVHPDCRRQGVGELLMQSVIRHGIASGARAIRLDVTTGNTPAIRLYEKCGFRYIDTVDLGLGEYGLPWFGLYEKVL